MFNFSNSNTKISSERKKQLIRFQKDTGVRFKNLGLLELAFRHRSSSKESDSVGKNNERLEFLGDSVLGLVVSSMLFSDLSKRPEGELAKIKSAVVSEGSLAEVALELNLDTYLILGKGEEMSGGRQKKAILADAFEAVVGALYIDAGFKSAERFVVRFIKPQIEVVKAHKQYTDFKSALQEAVQKKYRCVPKYTLDRTEGPDHARFFWVKVEVNGKIYGPCGGKNKKEAEQAAAELACKGLKIKVKF